MIVGVAEGVVVGCRGVPLLREDLGVGEAWCCFCKVVIRTSLERAVISEEIPILWSSPRPMSRKFTARMQAWNSSAMASEGLLRCGLDSLGRLWYMYSERFWALKTLPVLKAMMVVGSIQ